MYELDMIIYTFIGILGIIILMPIFYGAVNDLIKLTKCIIFKIFKNKQKENLLVDLWCYAFSVTICFIIVLLIIKLLLSLR